MRTTATMMFGCGARPSNTASTTFSTSTICRKKTGGFTAFIPWSFQPGNTALGGRHWDEATAVEYLKTLANLPDFSLELRKRAIQLGHPGPEGLPARPALRRQRRGARSCWRKNVVRSAGVSNCTTEEELRRMIRDAGFRPRAPATRSIGSLFLN